MVQLVNPRKVKSKVDDLSFCPSILGVPPEFTTYLGLAPYANPVSGIVNYSKPIKLLFCVEKREVVHVLYYDRCVEGTQGFVSQTRILVRTPLDVVDIRSFTIVKGNRDYPEFPDEDWVWANSC